MNLKLKDNPKIKLNNPVLLEYIQNDGNSWIDTGIDPIINTPRFIFEATGNNLICSNDSGVEFYWGTNSYFSALFLGKQSIKYDVNDIKTVAHKYSIQLNNKCYFDDIELALSASTNRQSSTTFKLLAQHDLKNNIITAFNNNRIKYFKVYDNSNNLILDLYPAISTETTHFGEVCMYDTISETFFYNKGNGNFIAGPITNISNNFKLKCTNLFHKNCPYLGGWSLLNTIYNYQAEHQDDVKYIVYIHSDTWQNIITTYPSIVTYANNDHRLVFVICESNNPTETASNFMNALSEYPSIASVIAEYPSIASVIAEWNPIVHSLIDTGYENAFFSTDNPVINPNILVSNTTTLSCKFYYDSTLVGDVGLGNRVGASGSVGFILQAGTLDNTPQFRYYLKGWYTLNNNLQSGKHIIDANLQTRKCTLDNTTVYNIITDSLSTANVDCTLGFINIKVYSMSINNLILVPFKRNNQYCMIDIHDLDNPTVYNFNTTVNITYSLETK